jgi:hypothetical protein
MRRTLLLLGVLWGVVVLWPGEAGACGDKFLVIGRSPKRVPKAHHPAAVLLYLRPGSTLPGAAKEMRLGPTLQEAGHAVDTAADAGALREILGARRFDFILADPADAPDVERLAGSSSSRPQVVPVVQKASDEAVRALEAQHAIVITAGRSLSYLTAIDEAMGRRSSAVASR